jgi:hypothetical protein
MIKTFVGAPAGIGAILVLAGVCGACHSSREVVRADWGALRGDERIVVLTHSGVRHDLQPFRFATSGLVGASSAGEVAVPLDSIALVEVRSVNTAGTLAAVLAAGTVIGIVVAEQQSDVKPEPVPSCPLVYSFDGERYVFDSETFAGAALPGLDRTDYDNLEHLRPAGGRYRLRMTNERPETEYTDQLRLVVVDHPAGTSVVPDVSGRPIGVTAPTAPRTARGIRGEDAQAAVDEADGIFWGSGPLDAVDPDRPEELRDGLVLTFARPRGARSARLLVRARNTELAPFALQTFLELQGDGLLPWYLRVARDGALRDRIKGWVAREGTLHVSVWEGGRWVRRGLLLDVGPAISKSQILELPLPTEGDNVLVRLESARGLWEIDWVALDGEPQPLLETREIDANRARDARGRDVVDVLASVDRRYYTSVEGDSVEIEFEMPPGPSPGFSRTVILKSTGYYLLHLPGTGPSQAALADRILDEPLVGNSYVLGKWRLRRMAGR